MQCVVNVGVAVCGGGSVWVLRCMGVFLDNLHEFFHQKMKKFKLNASLFHLVEVSHQNLAYLSLKNLNLGLTGDKFVACRINHIHIFSFL